ncbi:MAG: glycerate kinase, partial [Chloroflexia bacterium]|nr:glycerate kinase [Chloroflexia bacterium]
MAVTPDQAMVLLDRWYQAAIDAVEPGAAVRGFIQREGDRFLFAGRPVEVAGRLVVIAIGKAAMPMARAVADISGGLIDTGIVLTKDGYGVGPTPSRFVVYEADHPIPDDRGVAATRAILDLVTSLDAGDAVVALISGGGSALLEAPRPPVTLADVARTTDLLLRVGAPIGDLNAVRRPLSLVKAGGLLRAAAPARVYTAILSDVLGNDPRTIASGPTVPGAADPDAARGLLERYGVHDRVPASVRQALTERPGESTGPDAPVEPVVIIGDNNAAIDAARGAAAADGFAVNVAWQAAAGEASDLGRAWIEQCSTAPPDIDVLVGGGEATVTVRGDGLGGRNTEFALAAAIALEERGRDDWV